MQQESALHASLSMLSEQATQAKVLQRLSSAVSWCGVMLDSSCGQAVAAQQELLQAVKEASLAHSRHQCHSVEALQQPRLHAIWIHSLLTNLCQGQW